MKMNLVERKVTNDCIDKGNKTIVPAQTGILS